MSASRPSTPKGRFSGERRFVGLFTSSAYSLSTREIPLLRRKCAAVMARAGLAPASHDGKALAHILDTFPRDELFQISEDELFEIAMGILQIGRTAQGQALPAIRPVRPLRLGAAFRAPRSCHRRIAPEDPRHPGPRPGRPHVGRRCRIRRRRPGAHPLHHRPQPGPKAQGGCPRPGTARSRTRSGPGTMPSWRRCPPAMAAPRASGRMTARDRAIHPGLSRHFLRPCGARRIWSILERLAARRDGLKVRGARLSQSR